METKSVISLEHFASWETCIRAYEVGVRLDGDNWKGFAGVVVRAMKEHEQENGKVDIETMVNHLKSVAEKHEADYKKSTGQTRLPDPYRSAKSVALSCVGYGISLMDPDGYLIGKTAAQSAIKEHKEAAKGSGAASGKTWSLSAEAARFVEKCRKQGEDDTAIAEAVELCFKS